MSNSGDTEHWLKLKLAWSKNNGTGAMSIMKRKFLLDYNMKLLVSSGGFTFGGGRIKT